VTEPSSSPLSKHVRIDVSPARVARVWAGVSERLEHAPTSRRRWAYRGAIATALSGLLAFGAVKAMSDHQARSAWQKAALETAGDAMAVGLDDGSRLELAAHTKVRVVGNEPQSMALDLDHGRVDCDITPRPGRHFSVAAAGVVVRVKGTKFGVELAPSRDRVDVDVERGLVEVTWQDGAQHRDLAAGERWSIDLRHPEATAPSAAPSIQAPAAPASVEASSDAPPAASDNAKATMPHAPRDAAPGARELLDLGNAARRAGDAAGAARAYEELLTLHPGDGRAGLAAFELGRLRMDRLGDLPGAIQALQKAVMMAPGAGFREDAMARLVEAYARAGAVERCRSARGAYLSSYPGGVHASAVSRQCQER
jgi:transmembrane sensor